MMHKGLLVVMKSVILISNQLQNSYIVEVKIVV